MRPTVGQNDGHIEHVEWLSREKGTLGGDGLCFVEMLRVVIQQVLLLVSVAAPNDSLGYSRSTSRLLPSSDPPCATGGCRRGRRP